MEDTKRFFKSVLFWAAGNLVVLSTAAITNDTYGALIFTALWAFMLFMLFGIASISLGAFGLDNKIEDAYSQFDLDKYKPKVDQWKEMPKPKAWRAALFTAGSLFTLAYVEWTVTACVYLVLAVFAFCSTVYMTKVMNKFREKVRELEELDEPTSTGPRGPVSYG